MSGTPLTLAETASVFGEMLTFRALLDARDRSAPPADHARRQGRGHAQHRGSPDRLLPVRDAAARRAARRRAGARPHRRDLDADPDRKPWPCLRVHARLQGVLDLHPALRPLAVLRLRLCVRRLPGERALFGVPVRASGVPGEVSRHAARRRHQAAQGVAGAVRSRCLRPGVLAKGARRDRRVHRRVGAAAAPMAENNPGVERSTLFGELRRLARPPARSAASPRALRARACSECGPIARRTPKTSRRSSAG